MAGLSEQYTDRDKSEIYVWEITESESYYASKLKLNRGQQNHLKKMMPKRRLEFLASRYFILQSFGSSSLDDLQKDEHGKPFLIDMDIELGLSHSHGQVALIKSSKKVGIDIERLDRKIDRIAHKFLSNHENNSKPAQQAQKYLTSIWCAKEAMYKAYGKKKLEFATEMSVTLDEIQNEYRGIGILTKNTITEIYDLHFKSLDEMLLCWAIIR